MAHERAIELLESRIAHLVKKSDNLNWAIIGAGSTSERGLDYISERHNIDTEVNDLRLAVSELIG